MRRFEWSTILTAGLGLVATLGPTLPAPLPALTLATPLGRALYAVTVVTLTCLLVIAQHREAKRATAKLDRNQAEVVHGQRGLDTLVREGFRAITALLERAGEVGEPLAREIQTTTTEVMEFADLADYGAGTPLRIVGNAPPNNRAAIQQLFTAIADDPPTSAALVAQRASELRSYRMRAEPGDYHLTGADVGMARRDKDGNVIGTDRKPE